MRKILLVSAIIFVAVFFGVQFFQIEKTSFRINSFEDCINAGNLVMESYPRQCRDRGGNLHVEYIGNELEKVNLVRIHNPRPNQEIESPLVIQGEARGSWFFEASFPIVLTDEKGRSIVEYYATAVENWMTEDFVLFEAILTFPPQDAESRGMLILKKDNPSGLPENDDEVLIPIIF